MRFDIDWQKLYDEGGTSLVEIVTGLGNYMYRMGMTVQNGPYTAAAAAINGQWSRFYCTQNYPGVFFEPNTACTRCDDDAEYLTESSGCTACQNPNQDISNLCNAPCTVPGRVFPECVDCPTPNYLDSFCTACKEGFDIAEDCAACLPNRDITDDCRCNPFWHDEKDCLECEFGRTGVDCESCLPQYDATYACARCSSGVFQEACFERDTVLNVTTTMPGVLEGTPDFPHLMESCLALCVNTDGCLWFNWRAFTTGYQCIYSKTLASLSTLPRIAVSMSAFSQSVVAPQFCDEGPGYSERSDCSSCRNENWDVATDCTSCVGGFTEASNCLLCVTPNHDPATQCLTCINAGFDISTGCDGTCLNENFLAHSGSGCDWCRDGWDEAQGCTQCRVNFDPDDACRSCLPGVTLATECTTAAPVCAGISTLQIWDASADRCADGISPEKIYEYLYCTQGEALGRLSQLLECSADWVRNATAADYAAFKRRESFLLDAIVSDARLRADDATLSWPVRAAAEQLAGTWAVVRGRGSAPDFVMRYHPRLTTSSNTLQTHFLAPPFLRPFGSTRLLSSVETHVGAAQASYRAALEPEALLPLCRSWFQGFAACECGFEWKAESSRCVAVPEAALANTYALRMGVCALADGVLGSAASLALLRRTLVCVRAEVWAQQDPVAVSGLLELARTAALASAAAAPETLAPGDVVGVRDGLLGVAEDASNALGPTTADGAASVATIDSFEAYDAVDAAFDGFVTLLAPVRGQLGAVGGFLASSLSSVAAAVANDFANNATRPLAALPDAMAGAGTPPALGNATLFALLELVQQTLDENVTSSPSSASADFVAARETVIADAAELRTAVADVAPLTARMQDAVLVLVRRCLTNDDSEAASVAGQRQLELMAVITGAPDVLAAALEAAAALSGGNPPSRNESFALNAIMALSGGMPGLGHRAAHDIETPLSRRAHAVVLAEALSNAIGLAHVVDGNAPNASLPAAAVAIAHGVRAQLLLKPMHARPLESEALSLMEEAAALVNMDAAVARDAIVTDATQAAGLAASRRALAGLNAAAHGLVRDAAAQLLALGQLLSPHAQLSMATKIPSQVPWEDSLFSQAQDLASLALRVASRGTKEACGDVDLDSFRDVMPFLRTLVDRSKSAQRSLHALVAAARGVVGQRAASARRAAVVAALEAVRDELRLPAGGSLGASLPSLLSALQGALLRAEPSLASAAPGAFERLAGVQDGFLRGACNAARWRYLAAPDACAVRPGDVVQSSSSSSSSAEEALERRVEAMAAQMAANAAAWSPQVNWLRLRVASAAAVRSELRAIVLPSSEYAFSWPAAPVNESCGSNLELTAAVLVLESSAETISTPQTGTYEYTLSADGSSMLKTDENGGAHLFLAAGVALPVSFTQRARVVASKAGGCSGSDEEELQLRQDEYTLCYQQGAALSNLSPWGTKFTLTLGSSLADIISDRATDLDLVLYAKVSGVPADSAVECEAAQFASQGVVPPGTDGGGNDDESGSGDSNLPAIVGATVGAVVVVLAAALAARLLRNWYYSKRQGEGKTETALFTKRSSMSSMPEF